MRDLAQMDSEIGDYAQGARGSIRVFANTSVMVQYLPGDLSRFLAEHPEVWGDKPRQQRAARRAIRRAQPHRRSMLRLGLRRPGA